MTKNYSGVVRAMCLGLSLLGVASCSVLGASLDPLAKGSANGSKTCVGSGCTTCPPDQVACGTECFATANDPKHCGDCTHACKDGEVCGDGRCSASCPATQTNCGGSCVDTKQDVKNCGACGAPCDPDSECVDGKCLVACKTQLNDPTPDPWGWTWDGLERAASTFNDARNTCAQFRGRLPTPSELYRVSAATEAGVIGGPLLTTPIWSGAPAGANLHVRVRLSDGVVSSTELDSTKTNYRCVCPPALPKVYAGGNCYGEPNTNGCVALGGESGLHNIDTKDRVSVPKTAAVWECAQYGGHLATAQQLAEGVQQNIGVGSGKQLQSADETRRDQGVTVGWTDGADFVFQFNNKPNSVSVGAPTDPFPFRCVGESSAPPFLPQPQGQWSVTGLRNIDEADRPQAPLLEAVASCFAAGGHLPSIADLNEFILQGAPGGSGAFLWTSDQTGSNTAAIAKWTGIQFDHLYGGANMDWSTKTDNHPYRCAYYAVDPSYSGPPTESCQGECTLIASPGASGAKSWFDTNDRMGATMTVAIDTCRKLGGHVASERDFIEAIRGGLPNGSNVEIHTSDAMIGGGSLQLLVGTVKWTGTMLTFDDAWGSRSGSAQTTDTKPYRCMWTNELR